MEDRDTKKKLMYMQIIHVGIMLSIGIYCLIIYIFVPNNDIRVFAQDAPELLYIEVILGVATIIVFVIGYFSPTILGKLYVGKGKGLITIHIIRMSFLQSISVFGFMLGIIGARWQISLPFIIISGTVLLLTFPTTKYVQELEKNI